MKTIGKQSQNQDILGSLVLATILGEKESPYSSHAQIQRDNLWENLNDSLVRAVLSRTACNTVCLRYR